MTHRGHKGADEGRVLDLGFTYIILKNKMIQLPFEMNENIRSHVEEMFYK